MSTLCTDCGHEVNQDEYPVHDVCIRARHWNPRDGSRIDDVCDRLDERINEMRGQIMAADRNRDQELFDALVRNVEQQKQADEEHRQALLDHVREETARQRAEHDER
jgi:hypothetical protein